MAVSQRWGKHPEQLVRDAQWYNTGAPPGLLRREFVTPNELFFTRNHAAVPLVDRDQYQLRLSGLVERQLVLDLATIQSSMPRRTVGATLACAGLRRDELHSHRAIHGELPWGAEPISHGLWTGVPLSEVLRAAGVQADARYVQFFGLDQVSRAGTSFPFGGSIPLSKAMASEVLLAFELNGESLPAVHGFPLRVVVPGYIGARSVKWLSEIVISSAPSENYFQAHAYKMFPPEVTPDTVRWDQGRMLDDLPLNSVIWSPEIGEALPSGRITVHGWAMAGRGRGLARVEVSPDGGRTWVAAEISDRGNRWSWNLWTAEVTLQAGRHELVVRAIDSSGETQPERVDGLWNFKGYLNNAWHRVEVVV